MAPDLVHEIADLRRHCAAWRKTGDTIALVPTMGALHDGHLRLVTEARARCRRVVVSIFVNPAQFAPGEDFERYPRTLAADRERLAGVAADLIWAPEPATMYPPGFATRIVPEGAAQGLETQFRPHFFAGVATVCCKLFTQVMPDIAVFGEKDYQQLLVVRQMARDLDLPLTVVGVETVREPDGLAMSSRNRYLSAKERATAATLPRVVAEAARAVAGGGDIAEIERGAASTLAQAGFRVDYVAVRDAETLGPAATGRAMRILAAAWLGKTRLIDNMPVPPAT